MKTFLYAATIIMLSQYCIAQNVGINNGASAPDASAMLDLKSANKGLLIPRVALTTSLDNTTIPSPQISLLIYNTATAGAGNTVVTPGFYFWNGSAWTRLINDASVSGSIWLLGGNG